MKKIHILFTSLLIAFSAGAAIPAGYYDACENTGGQSLLKALYNTIGSHTTVSYSGLWTLYYTSDVDADGKIWDMYSTKRWTPGKEQCGTYSVIGDCYNREHSFPKSWFNDASPMVSDAFHIYPTDGKVNGQRSNNPFGECANGTYVASKGNVKALGRLGTSTFPGYSGLVFEPDDQYKGDFARSYFYMAACYNDRIASWKSEMLAKNNFPVFSTWALNLLLKWHRQDPVSQKELDRNEAVYAKQHNRNPFIDHPEMVEYIWGDKSSQRWTSGATVGAAINSPLNGTSIDMGQMVSGMTATRDITLKTTGATEPVFLSTDDRAFAVSPTRVEAAAANAGVTVRLTFTPVDNGTAQAELTIVTGDTEAYVNLTGTCVSTLPVNGAIGISTDSFTATWQYIGDTADGMYTLRVWNGTYLLDGYPRRVPAAAGRYVVDDLDADTEYSYLVSSDNLDSEFAYLRTAKAIPWITFLYDNDELSFQATPGEPTEAAEIMVDAENVEGDYEVSVDAPFQISLDKASWDTSIVMTDLDDRFYIRLFADEPGSYHTYIVADYGDYTFDTSYIDGTVAKVQTSFLEDFEPEGDASYNPQTYYGTACRWNLKNGGFWPNQDHGYSGKQSLRAGRDLTALVEMAEDRTAGIGTVSFYAHRYGTDAATTLAIEYSTDGGQTWLSSGNAEITSTSWEPYTVAINVPGTVRMRLRQTAGKRFLLDDLALTSYTTGITVADTPLHQWDAYGRDGALVVEIKPEQGLDVTVYSLDGLTVYSGHLPLGTHFMAQNASGNYYIVVCGDDARTVPVR